MSDAERLRRDQQQNLCVNCFRGVHTSKFCRSGACKKCSKKHNTLLYFEGREKSKRPLEASQSKNTYSKPSARKVMATTSASHIIFIMYIRENPTALSLHRFIGLGRRLLRNEDIRVQYTKFFIEYEQLGHTLYSIPHHCVLKPDSTTTKLRVEFDASTKTSSGYSLNDLMYTGPTIQSELFSILLRFRLPKFVFTADIEKMYR